MKCEDCMFFKENAEPEENDFNSWCVERGMYIKDVYSLNITFCNHFRKTVE